MEFPSLRAAGKKLTSVATDAAQAVRGLRMPGVGAQAPAAPAAAPTGTPFPTIDPSMADRATATMRASKPLPPIPTLTDVIESGVGPVNRPPPIPTLTDVIEPGTVKPPPFNPAPGTANPNTKGAAPGLRGGIMGPPTANPNVGAGGSAQRAAWEASRAAPAAPVAPAAAPAGQGIAQGAKNLAAGAIRNAPSKLGTLGGGLTAGLSFAPHWDAFGDDSTLDAGQKAKLMLRDTTRAVGGVVGGVLGGAVGSGLAGPVGTVAGGVAGGAAGFEGVDALGGGLRRGLNAINEGLGGDANYITSTDEDLAADAARRAPKAAPAAPTTLSAAAAPAVPTTPADIAAFNARMGEMGATGVGMRAGLTPDSRVIYGTDAGPEKQAMTDQRMAQRTADVRAQDATAAQGQEARFAQLAANERADAIARREFDASRYDADINAAKASGSAVRIAQAYGAREAAQKSFESGKQNDVQSFTSMRNADVQAGAQQAQASATAAAANRKAATDEREFGLKAAQFGLDQRKFEQVKDENDEEVLRRQGEQNAERVAAMVKPTGDPVRDQARVAQYKQALPVYVSQIKAQLEAHLKDNPDDKTARSALDGYTKRGVAHLNDDDIERFLAGMEFTELAQREHSAKFNPVGGTSTNRVGPAMGLRRVDNVFGDTYVDDSGAEVPARFIDSDGSFVLQPPNVRFNSLKDRK